MNAHEWVILAGTAAVAALLWYGTRHDDSTPPPAL